MIVDHVLYDLAFIFREQWFEGQQAKGFLYILTSIARQFFLWMGRDIGWWVAVFFFVFICGVSCSFSHSNLKRGFRLLGVALLLSLGTYGIDRYLGQENVFTIRFGVLHMLAISILIYCLIRGLNRNLLIVLGIATIGIGIYFLNIPLKSPIPLSAVLVRSTAVFYSSDYFPLLPWFGFFLLGAALGPVIYPNKRSLFPNARVLQNRRTIRFIGRHSLVFYILHQPIAYCALLLIGALFIK